MRLLGRDVSADAVMAYVQRRLEARGLAATPSADAGAPPVEPRVDPLTFNLGALTEHADPTVGLPVETHRGGLPGLAVVAAKTAFRRVGQVFINEALARQGLFNAHVRDSYAELSAEVLQLRARIAELEAAAARTPGEPPPPPPPSAPRPRRRGTRTPR